MGTLCLNLSSNFREKKTPKELKWGWGERVIGKRWGLSLKFQNHTNCPGNIWLEENDSSFPRDCRENPSWAILRSDFDSHYLLSSDFCNRDGEGGFLEQRAWEMSLSSRGKCSWDRPERKDREASYNLQPGGLGALTPGETGALLHHHVTTSPRRERGSSSNKRQGKSLSRSSTLQRKERKRI